MNTRKRKMNEMNNQNFIINKIKNLLNEAPPMSFGPELGGARPSQSLQSKIEKGQLPLSKFGLTQAQVDFFTSEAFKESIVNLERLFNRYSGIERRLVTGNQYLKRDAETAFAGLYSLVGELINELLRLQSRNSSQLEEIATESVERAMGIDREFFSNKLKLDGKFTNGYLKKLKGMKERVDNISDEEIIKKFASIDAEKKEKLEQMRDDFESMGAEFDEEKAKEAVESSFVMSDETKQKAKQEFSDEVSRRMIINLFRRGMSLNYANAYEICSEQIEELPGGDRIIQLSNILQPIMLHMYWLFPDIGSVGTSGGGQIGQIQVLPPKQENSSNNDDEEEDEEDKQEETPTQQNGPFIIQARAMTLPLLVHELVKGVIMFFTSAGGEKSEKSVLAKQQASSLEIEAYDLVYGEKFFTEFYKLLNNLVPDKQEQRDITPFILKFISEEKYETLVELAKSLFTLGLTNPEFAENYVSELVAKSKGLQKKMGQNPSYSKKKTYKREEGDDDYLSSLGL